MICEACGAQNGENTDSCFICGFAFKDGVYELIESDDGSRATNQARTIEDSADYAGMWIRIAAYFIDNFILTMSLFATTSVIGLFYPIKFGGKDPIVLVIACTLMWFYYTLFEGSEWQASPGKKVIGIRVTDKKGNRITYLRSGIRAFLKIGLMAVPYIRWFIYPTALIRKDKQTLYDLLAGTYVMQ